MKAPETGLSRLCGAFVRRYPLTMALHSRRDSNESTLRAAGLTLKRKDGATIVFVGDKGAKVTREPGGDPAADAGDPQAIADEAAEDAGAEPAGGSAQPGQLPRD